MSRVAIIFDNFGPYHWARLEAAGRVCNLLAIELRDSCAEHGWVRQHRSVSFRTRTLVKGTATRKLSVRELSRRLAEELAEFKPQVVFLPGWSCGGAFVAQHWCSLNAVPTVVMSESNSWDEKRSAPKEWVKRRLARSYSAALVGGNTHKRYMTELGLPVEQTFLGYDAVDNGYFAAKAEESRKQKGECRKRHDLPERYFLASARFVEKKNLPKLIEAYARYRALAEKAESGKQKVEIWDLVLLGDGPLRSDLCQLIADLSLKDSVHLPGFVQYENLPAHYGLAGAFIHTSTTEQWGLVVNEAMASGLPVLVSNRCGCAQDLVQAGSNGFTFDPHNVDELAGWMFQISAFQPVRLSAFGDASRAIISHWGTERFGQGTAAAAAKAQQAGPRRPSLFDFVLLQCLAVFK